MIHLVSADQEQFKTVTFQPGLNIVMAERTKGSSSKDSRNGLGKSTLIDIIHFCLGSNPGRSDVLRQAPLQDWTFELHLDLRGKLFRVRRNTQRLNKIIVEGDTSDWPISPRLDPQTGDPVLTRDEWTRLLGWAMYDLPFQNPLGPYSPTFRSLISYFIRRSPGGYLNPFAQHPQQAEWDKQVNISFLLGLNWEHARRWQVLRDRESDLKQLSSAMRSGIAEEFLGSLGSLESSRVLLEREVQREADSLASFEVHPQYREIEEEANTLTFAIRDLTNQNVADQGVLSLYEQSLEQEAIPDEHKVAEVFAEAGVVLSDQVVRRLDEVIEFHRQVVNNRRQYLEGEIERLRSAIAAREARIGSLTQRRAEYMGALRSYGALDEYTRLQRLHAAKVAELEDLDRRIALRRKSEQERSAIKIEKERLKLDARADLEDRRSRWEEAIALFNANSEALYDAPGELVVDLKDSGFRFEVEIERSGSHGIGHMKVFCFDLMLSQLWSGKPVAPGFLVHDSIIYDGVDERQRAKALQLAAQEGEARGFQYICCLNSDMVPYGEFVDSFDLDKYIRLVLTDLTDEGGLLGTRF